MADQQVQPRQNDLNENNEIGQVPQQNNDQAPNERRNVDDAHQEQLIEIPEHVIALAKFTRHEFLYPIKLSLLVVIAFWSILLHGSLATFLGFAFCIFMYSITTVRDFIQLGSRYPIPYGTRVLEIRLIQVFMMHCQITLLHIFYFITKPLTYFKNFDALGEDVSNFLSGTGKYAHSHWTAYIRISIQVFALSYAWVTIGRLVVNLFLMSSSHSFRSVLKYESSTLITGTLSVGIGVLGFNHFADNYGRGSQYVALFLLLSLLSWVIMTVVKTTVVRRGLVVPRTNNVSGLLRVMTVIMCQLFLGGLLYTSMLFSVNSTVDLLGIRISNSTPEASVFIYWEDVKNRKFIPGNRHDVIQINFQLLDWIAWHVMIGRLLKLRSEFTKLTALDNQLL